MKASLWAVIAKEKNENKNEKKKKNQRAVRIKQKEEILPVVLQNRPLVVIPLLFDVQIQEGRFAQ